VGLPWYSSSASIWFMSARVGSVVVFSSFSFTYFPGRMKRSSAPQKVRPKPMNARMTCS